MDRELTPRRPLALILATAALLLAGGGAGVALWLQRSPANEALGRPAHALVALSPESTLLIVLPDEGEVATVGIICAPGGGDKKDWLRNPPLVWSHTAVACITEAGGVRSFDLVSGELVEVMPEGSCLRSLRFSPTGQHIACLGEAEGRAALRIRTSAGGYLAQVVGVRDYEWAPDRDLLLTERVAPGRAYVLTPTGGVVAQVPAAIRWSGRWSPESTRVGWISGEALVAAELDGSGTTREIRLRWPRASLLGWSRDSSRAFIIPFEGPDAIGIWSVGLDGATPELVLDAPGLQGAVLASDGRTVAYWMTDPATGRGSLFLGDLDSGRTVHVGAGAAAERQLGPQYIRLTAEPATLCWLSGNSVVSCYRSETGRTTTLELGDESFASDAAALARVTCDGAYVGRLVGEGQAVFLEVAGEEGTVLRAAVRRGTEPLWRCP